MSRSVSGEFKKIVNLRPALDNVSLQCIIIDKKEPEPRQPRLHLFLISDDSGSIVMTVYGDVGFKLMPGKSWFTRKLDHCNNTRKGDMIVLTSVSTFLYMGSMRIKVDRDERLTRTGE
jgi:hypothetical protein